MSCVVCECVKNDDVVLFEVCLFDFFKGLGKGKSCVDAVMIVGFFFSNVFQGVIQFFWGYISKVAVVK